MWNGGRRGRDLRPGPCPPESNSSPVCLPIFSPHALAPWGCPWGPPVTLSKTGRITRAHRAVPGLRRQLTERHRPPEAGAVIISEVRTLRPKRLKDCGRTHRERVPPSAGPEASFPDATSPGSSQPTEGAGSRTCQLTTGVVPHAPPASLPSQLPRISTSGGCGREGALVCCAPARSWLSCRALHRQLCEPHHDPVTGRVG